METWRNAPDYEGTYEVSSLGRVRRVDTGNTLALSPRPSGYLSVNLSLKGKATRKSVHRLVARAFHGEPEEGQVVCHNDGDKTNNRAENLRFDTVSENCLDIVRHGRSPQLNREECPRGHPLEEGNLRLRVNPKSGRRKRECRACARATSYVGINPEFKPYRLEVSNFYFEKGELRGPAIRQQLNDYIREASSRADHCPEATV